MRKLDSVCMPCGGLWGIQFKSLGYKVLLTLSLICELLTLQIDNPRQRLEYEEATKLNYLVKHVLKDLQKELQNQQGSIDSTRESLNTLCRKYPSEELAGLGSALTDLIKTYESVNQVSARTLASLQNCLQQQFNGEKSETQI